MGSYYSEISCSPGQLTGIGLQVESGSATLVHNRLLTTEARGWGTYDLQVGAGSIRVLGTQYRTASGTITHIDQWRTTDSGRIEAAAADQVPVTIKAAAAQTGALLNITNSSDASLASVSAAGVVAGAQFTGPATALKSATTTVDVSAATAPTVGQVLTGVDTTHATWQTPAAPATPTLAAVTAAGATTATDTTFTGTLTRGTPVTADATADSIFAASSATQTPLVVQGAAAQSVPLQEWQRYNGTVLAKITDITSGASINGRAMSLHDCAAGAFTQAVCLTSVDTVAQLQNVYTSGWLNASGAVTSATTVQGATVTATSVAIIPSGAAPAATCTVGSIYIDTDETNDTNCATTLDNSLCICTATNVWTALEN
jgi:hypothetical protein